MKILYISYDGLTDPLGNSQILPYLIELSQLGHQFELITYDKENRAQDRDLVKYLKEKCFAHHIHWHPLKYHKKYSLLATAYDIYQGYRFIKNNIGTKDIDIIHCRGYVSSLLALIFKKKLKSRFLFDMRGFWPEEKTDGKAWKENGLPYRLSKYFEKKFLKEADGVIILTRKGKDYLTAHKKQYPYEGPVEVIPTATDLERFSVSLTQKKKRIQELKRKKEKDFHLLYSGSIGSWYKPEEMLLFFAILKKKYPESRFSIYTNQIESEPLLRNQARFLGKRRGIPNLNRHLFIGNSSYQELPAKISQADFTISFIEPCFSKISSFPTKFGETLGVGLPQIINKGIGDTDEITEKEKIGLTVNEFSEEEYEKTVDQIEGIIISDEDIIDRCRSTAEKHLDLKNLSLKYHSFYKKISSSK